MLVLARDVCGAAVGYSEMRCTPLPILQHFHYCIINLFTVIALNAMAVRLYCYESYFGHLALLHQSPVLALLPSRL